MHLEDLKQYILAKRESVPSYPFDETTLVIKVAGKIFALVSESEDPTRINLKCDPDDAQVLRGLHKSIIPGYHMNKEHWNSIFLDGTLPNELIKNMIDDSYNLVVKGLKVTDRERLYK